VDPAPVRYPVLTPIAVGVATLAAVVQYAVPGAVPLLERDPAGLRAGQWWRLASPLLVQTLGWYQVLANLVTLAVVGLVAERVLGRWRWLALFAGGAVGGQAAAYAWHEPGGGDSVAICGLAAGVSVALLLLPAPPRLPAHVPVYYIAALAGWSLRGAAGAALAVLGAAAFLYGARRIRVPAPERIALAGSLVCAVALAVRCDLHGASLVSGMLLAGVLSATATARRRHPRTADPRSPW
jgi:membrane associated rhomboid family serine protease